MDGNGGIFFPTLRGGEVYRNRATVFQSNLLGQVEPFLVTMQKLAVEPLEINYKVFIRYDKYVMHGGDVLEVVSDKSHVHLDLSKPLTFK